MTMPSIAIDRLPRIRLRGVFLRRTDFSHADLTGANFSGADASNASFVGADFRGAKLEGTILRGADLSDARNLTHEQLAAAVIDERTRLPPYIDRQRLRP